MAQAHHDFTKRTLSTMARAGRRIRFVRGTRIFCAGDAGDCMYLLRAGKVKIVEKAWDGRETLMALLGPGDAFGELSVFEDVPRTSTATTLTEVVATSLNAASLMACLRDDPDFAYQLCRKFAQRLRDIDDARCAVTFTDMPGRVAAQLLALAARFGVPEGRSIRVDHELTQSELGQLVGCSRVSVSKTLSGFEEREWIRRRGKSIWVDAHGELAARARATPDPLQKRILGNFPRD